MFRRRRREPVAPDEDAVVRRLLCISVVAMLGAIAAALADGTAEEEQAAEYLTESHRWLIREKLVDDLSGRERALIAKALGEWTQQELTNAGLRNESLGVLLWALSALDEIPPYDASFERLPSLVPLLAPTGDFRAQASLRPADVIGGARDVSELWHWRARTRHLQERGETQIDGHDLAAVIRQAAALAHADGSIAEPIDGDFPAYGKPYRALDPEEYDAATSTAVERHYVLNWLSGYASDWDRVPTDT